MKNYYLTIALLFNLFFSAVTQAEIEFYKHNSALSIAYTLRVYELDDNPQRKLVIAKRLSKTMFVYWCETRFSDLEKSREMDSMLIHAYSVYKDGTMKGGGLKKIFEDPLDWANKKRDQFLIKGEDRIKNEQHYKKLLVQYFLFLKEGVAP